MKQAQKGDAQFLEMIRQNEGIIYKITSFYTDKDHPISDLYQEVVLNLWKAFPSFRGESKYSTWIYRIALNTCVSFFRRSKRDVTYVDITMDIPETVETNEDIQELYKLINRLGKIERALVLLYLDDKSYKEIAEITGLSVTNVATKLSRIKDKLKQMSNEQN
ncbi:RNA polymerase sigma-70 factor (ECF subfamily) [Dysgonomonas sp. PFB1-18]|uniref:RNA polymerase sigma factor n=1 Tax=unclassified Dysgonomonas TaxID=2630389 RepID=UPI00247532AC|nr:MULTISPECIES: sigma-70 family RNA polymerase sigma factor [unclassified Dysgonomonas]MDL2303141.1 sigma-70 family RNA polymerase sigma factor [Dysgonomonas sp. OttesenSCG-928-D17]MDH6308172.1 RNA polymerase sigma-70 factor (ECF subfamily) [Dysgonomonas sp. PF1-14]MDH6338389.1 RNA polymerase sigma-70 factor (ECF subfamily) [Dysgonomonas sp. PF1-16]MDH6379886.1 RNA polymerase sigma-70 factor (ECF subfamily) [Dysgonomonas sp. PFB1-18]MDH6397024.1 RNA polymerase sigma-70 factor (ECF subfamily) 